MTDSFFSSFRKTYESSRFLDEKDFSKDPFKQFEKWFSLAKEKETGEVNAFILSTSSLNQRVSSRVVLLKSLDTSGLVFFTNYTSKKVCDIEENPFVSALFFWPNLNKQVRIRGKAQKVSRQESEAYFETRPYESQIGAWASKQSKVLQSRKDLENKYKELKMKFSPKKVPCPDFWGGIKIVADYFEFWQGQSSRLHDRIAYTQNQERKHWEIERLSP